MSVLHDADGLVVRPYRPSDVDALPPIADNPNVVRYLTDAFPHPYTRADAEAWIAFASVPADGAGHWAIEWNGELAGGIGIRPKTDVYARTAGLGYWLGEAYWGRGLATRAVRAVTEHAFLDPRPLRIEAVVFSRNSASARVLKKAGYTFEGRLRDAVFKNGFADDLLLYAHTRPRSEPEVVVVDPDPEWPAYFRALGDYLSPALTGIPHTIEHVGSTSVPGLAAKPIIDMTVVVPEASWISAVIARLEGLGYRHRGDLGIPGREAFAPPPAPPDGVRWMRHNLYAAPRDSAVGLQNPLRFRDYLRTHPDAVAEYAQLKRGLAEAYADNVDRYCRAKTLFILDCLRQTGMPENELAAVRRANLGDDAEG